MCAVNSEVDDKPMFTLLHNVVIVADKIYEQRRVDVALHAIHDAGEGRYCFYRRPYVCPTNLYNVPDTVRPIFFLSDCEDSQA